MQTQINEQISLTKINNIFLVYSFIYLYLYVSKRFYFYFLFFLVVAVEFLRSWCFVVLCNREWKLNCRKRICDVIFGFLFRKNLLEITIKSQVLWCELFTAIQQSVPSTKTRKQISVKKQIKVFCVANNLWFGWWFGRSEDLTWFLHNFMAWDLTDLYA